ncbi:winged helix DNA-binding domain-containing protein [Streptomyces sp. Edi4]|uniref:winged helix DNA-binding domain-containing protein n=1 Tax=Streptomyces sp. Edi4 TaxID=3162527 RepID=UPI003305F487
MTADAEVWNRRALNRALLARQLLTERAPVPAAEGVARLVGLQAQAPNPPYIGLWTRLSGFRIEDLARAVGDRAVVRLAMMRGTIHLVTAEDCLALRPVLQPSLERALNSTFGRLLTGLDLPEVAAIGRQLVEARPATLGMLGKLLAERLPDRDAFALANVVRTLVPLVQIPPRGLWGESGQAVHTTAESWLGRTPGRDVSPDTMVRRYLAAFGPASVKDIQTWSGMTRLAEPVRRLRPGLRTFRDENGVELFDLPDAPRPGPDLDVPVRYLPEFDNILLSHADRSRVISAEHRKLVFTRNGLIKSTFLVDGFVRGVWRLEQHRSAATLVLEAFDGPLAKSERTALAEEGARLLRFAAADADVHDIRFH